MYLETTLTDIIARLRQGRFPSTCHSELIEESQQFSPPSHQEHQVEFHPSALIPHPFPSAGRKEYRSRNRRSQTRAAIPEAWRELDESRRDAAVSFQPQRDELLASAVESKAGIRTDVDDVAEFLAAQETRSLATLPVPIRGE